MAHGVHNRRKYFRVPCDVWFHTYSEYVLQLRVGKAIQKLKLEAIC